MSTTSWGYWNKNTRSMGSTKNIGVHILRVWWIQELFKIHTQSTVSTLDYRRQNTLKNTKLYSHHPWKGAIFLLVLSGDHCFGHKNTSNSNTSTRFFAVVCTGGPWKCQATSVKNTFQLINTFWASNQNLGYSINTWKKSKTIFMLVTHPENILTVWYEH